MRDSSGKELLNVYRYKPWEGVYVAAKTKKEAASIFYCEEKDISRVKGFYASGQPRALK